MKTEEEYAQEVAEAMAEAREKQRAEGFFTPERREAARRLYREDYEHYLLTETAPPTGSRH